MAASEAAGAGAPAPPNPAHLPASDAFARWVAQQGGPTRLSAASAQSLATGLNLGQARAREMRALMQTDPEQFVQRSMPESERSQLPASLQPYIEHRLKARGSYAIYCVLPRPGQPQPIVEPGQRGGYAYEAHINGLRYWAYPYGKWRNQKTVADASIDGVVLGDGIALGDAPTPKDQQTSGQPVSAYSPTTTGPNTLLYMVARFSDQSSDPISDSTVLSQMAVVSNFWLNCSEGTVYIHGLVNPSQVVDIVHITLPEPSSYASTYNNNFAQLLSDARTAAAALGYNYANYNLDVVVTTSAGFSYAGLSYVGAQGSHWVAGYTSLRTAGHELGHNLGLYHANYWRTDSTQPFGEDSNPGGYVADRSNGEWVEYGHYFSVMSGQYGSEWDDATKPIYNPVEKVQLGWLSGSQVQYVSASGTYRLFRNDARTTVGAPRGIRIETPATDYTGYGRRYWLEYRYAPWNTAQNWFQNGLEIDVAAISYGADGSTLLDMTPYSKDQSSPFYDANSPPSQWWTIDNSDKLDGALLIGRTYSDTPAGIHITPIDRGSNGAGEEYIDVAIDLGTFPDDRAPVISSFTATANQAAPGQAVSFAVSASDPDNDALAYSWDFGDVQVWTASGLNSPSASKSWSSAGQYRVQVTVSDMKGGVATASQIITVGTPSATNEIWGRVVWAGQPVYGARVSTTTGIQAWTDSDGSYELAGLASSSYTLNCQANGLTFTPQFSEPVALAGTSVYGADFYANEPPPNTGANTYTISGEVTDPVNGVSGAEVRGAGMLAITDASGNYQLTNLVNGAYTVTAENGSWSFSPSSRSVAISSANSTGNNFSRVAPYSLSGSFSGIPTGNHSAAPTVYLSNGRSVQASQTGTGGSKYWAYTFNSVPPGQYSLSAELSGYSLVPSGFSNPLTISGNQSGLNFSGAAASVAGAISGRIIQLGLPVAGVLVQANQGASTIGSASSDVDGDYRIENLAGGSYTVVPSKTGWAFSPSSLAVSGVPAGGENFTATGPNAPPSISSVTANPAVVPNSSSTTSLSVAASGSGPLTYSWDATSAAGPVTFTPNDSIAAASTTVAFQAPGTYTFRARVTDANGLPAIGAVNVTVSAGPGSMVVAPYQVQVVAGNTATFHADAWDRLGNTISVSPAWSATGGGAITGAGLFTATTPGGPYEVIATGDTLSATGYVWVTSPPETPPVAGADTIERDPSSGVKVSIADLLSNDSDADGDSISFAGIGAASANGGTLATNEGWVFYTPAPDFTNTDTFTYTISDGFNAPATGTVAVNIRTNNAASPNLTSTDLGNGVYHVQGDGIPGRTYRIQYTSDLQNPAWQTLGSTTTDGLGVFVFEDTAGHSGGYYRSVYP